MPFFSVIIPVFNKENFIKDTIDSVLSQDFSDFEIIIMNDGSTDNSITNIESINDERIQIFNQENQGVAAARNNAIALAKGKYMALIDADDLWKHDHLNNLKHAIELFPNALLYCTNYEVQLTPLIIKPAQFNIRLKDEPAIIEDFFDASIINSIAWTSAVAFTKETHEELNGFKDTYETCEDLDFWIKAALHGDIVFHPKITMTYKKFVENSLMKNDNNILRYNFINSYSHEAFENASLKRFLDINRYALAIRCLLSGEKEVYKKALNEIDPINLNWKQKLLVKSPKFVLKGIKKIQSILAAQGLYLTAFK